MDNEQKISMIKDYYSQCEKWYAEQYDLKLSEVKKIFSDHRFYDCIVDCMDYLNIESIPIVSTLFRTMEECGVVYTNPNVDSLK